MKQIIVNVADLTNEEKQRVNEALAKIQKIHEIRDVTTRMAWLYAPSSFDSQVGWSGAHTNETPTHTPQQVLEMAGMEKKGHVHAELMAQYAEDAKTHAEPWKLWQVKADDGVWYQCQSHPRWGGEREYRSKPKTHTVHGVEIPDLRVSPKHDGDYYLANPTTFKLISCHTFYGDNWDNLWVDRGLVYPKTEEGKQAAILHSKAMLGIV